MAKKHEEQKPEKALDWDTPGDWEEENLGFAPYWNPYPGASFRARLISKDIRDPMFVRYVLINTDLEPLRCQKGPAEDAEEVFVGPGEQFTMSFYHSLPLDHLFGLEFAIMATEKIDTNNNRKVWNWKLRLPREAKAELNARRQKALVPANAPKSVTGTSDSTSSIQ